jgi:GNAT superfamily N-acetyltransferase
MKYHIQPIEPEDRQNILKIIDYYWHGEFIVIHGEIFYPSQLSGIKAVRKNRIVGILHFLIQTKVCEIITLESLIEHQGIGAKLISAVEEIAINNHCEHLQVTTTNDNLPALGFYQKLGFHLIQLKAEQIAQSRKLKPTIPAMGYKNIPIRDEIVLEKTLGSHLKRKFNETNV